MVRKWRVVSAVFGLVVLALAACMSPTGPEDREPKDDTEDGGKSELSLLQPPAWHGLG